MSMAPMRIAPRWIAVGVFILSSALNYLDRMILPALAPLIMTEFRLTQENYGQVLRVFAIAYAISSPAAGLFIDRIGLNRGVSIAVAFWSVAGIATGLARGLGSFMICRAALAIGESAGIPSSGKVMHRYLKPDERALGGATSLLGLTIGSVLAPPFATWMALNWGWRSAFLVTGALGFFWIPLWLWTARRIPPVADERAPAVQSAWDILRSVMMWGFIGANLLTMTIFTFWTNWTTLYLIRTFTLPLEIANTFAPIPQIAGYAGGIIGGWMSLRWMRRGVPALDARRRACLLCALAALSTAAVPMMPNPLLATLGISVSMLATTALSVNLYTMPLDAFGGARAAFATSLLTGAYGVTMAAVSPHIGRAADQYGYAPVCMTFSFLPLVGYLVLILTARPPLTGVDQTKA